MSDDIGLGRDPAEPGTNTLVSDTEGSPSFTYIADWGWMSDVSDQGWRYYSCVRSFIFDKPSKWTLTITDETVADLLKRSVKSVQRARQECYKAGLVEELELVKRQVPIPGQTKREVRTFRTLRVVHMPPAGYEGPVNCFTEKDRIEGAKQAAEEAARTERQQATRAKAAAGRATRSRSKKHEPRETNLSSRSDQAKQASDADRSDWTDLSAPRTDLSQPETHVSPATPPEQVKQPPKQAFKQEKPTNRPVPAVAADAAGVLDGWLDGLHATTSTHPSRGELLLGALPAPWNLGARAITEEGPRVTALLEAGWTEPELIGRWTAQPAQNPPGALRYRIADTPDLPNRRSGRQRTTDGPPWCGNCGSHLQPGWAANNPRMRLIVDPSSGNEIPCPECHPSRAVSANATSSTTA